MNKYLCSTNKLIWILQTGEPLHCDMGNPRPMRAMNLANALIEHGHNVVLWSSAFYHQEKKHRSKSFKSIIVNNKLTINLIPSIGYKKNIGLGRLFDHAHLAYNLSKQLKTGNFIIPDVAFIGYPPIETASVMLNWLKMQKIPTIIDIKDMWPALFLEPFPKIFKPIIKFLLTPYFYLGRKSIKDATALSSMSQSYLNWMSLYSGRKLNSLDKINYLTSPLYKISPEKNEEVVKWRNNLNIYNNNKHNFIFVGSFMSVYDFTVVRDTAKRFLNEKIKCKFIICGDGAFSKVIKEIMYGLPNVIFTGWIDRAKISYLVECCSGAIVPYRNIENFTSNIPNKVIDALSNGLPIITTLNGEVKELVESERVGFVCNNNSKFTMYDAMRILIENPNLQKEMSQRAFNLYKNLFSYEKVYGDLVTSIENLANN